ncbi:hypothetical protein [Rhodobacter capsulatus]|uniref:hypothetical protein n=1 Tax=Rhodobacter capsulatus TaxID=1061 RepID=UPI0040250CF9
MMTMTPELREVIRNASAKYRALAIAEPYHEREPITPLAKFLDRPLQIPTQYFEDTPIDYIQNGILDPGVSSLAEHMFKGTSIFHRFPSIEACLAA